MNSRRILLFLMILIICSFNKLFSQTVSTLVSQISTAGIEALSIDNFGNLYTPSGPSGTVYKISPVGEVSIFASGLNFPQGGTTDKEGNTYISNWNSGIITKITSSGIKTEFFSGFFGPTGLTFNNSGDEFYVSNYSTNSITKINLTNNTRSVFSSNNGINGPDGIVFDESGNLYVANFKDNKINKIDQSGNISEFAVLPGNNSGYITYAKGNIYAAGHGSHKIYKITLDGIVSSLAGRGIIGSEDGFGTQAKFNTPNGITASLTGDSLFVVDAGSRSIRIIDLTATTSIGTDSNLLNNDFRLYQNYPNPFNPETTITFEVTATSIISLNIYDALGKLVTELLNDARSPGKYSINFNANNLSSGIYFYKLKADNYLSVKKMLLLK